MRVLILYDNKYNARFWTLYESYLSMQWPSPAGLEPAVERYEDESGKPRWQAGDDRWTVVDVNEKGGTTVGKEQLEKNWLDLHVGVDMTMDRLGRNDVDVTNKSDKEKLIPLMKKFEDKLKEGHPGRRTGMVATRLPKEGSRHFSRAAALNTVDSVSGFQMRASTDLV